MKKQVYKIKFIAAFGALLFVGSGCSDDFLQDEKTNGLSDEIVYSSPETATAVVTGIYDTFQAGPSEYLTKAVFYPANFLTQDFLNVGADTFFQTFEIPTNFSAFNGMWVQNYAGIGRANSALASLPAAIEAGNIDAELGNRLIGEATAIRGMLYYLLTANFGGVPLVLEPAGGNVDAFAPRNTQDEVFEQIAVDMEAAALLLPWSYDDANKGRATKGMALAYAGSAYMWLGQYDKAITAFEALDGHYTLETEFLDIHANANANGMESIFEVQFYDEAGDLSWGRNDNVTFLQSFCMPQEAGGGGAYAVATQGLYDSFEAGDTRKAASVIGPGDEHPDALINISDYPNVADNFGGINTCGTVDAPWLGTDGSESFRNGHYGVKTWRNPNTDGWSGANLFSGQNLIFLRYGEVLLSLAEAYHKTGNDAQAMEYVMQIRDRAWGGSAPTPTGDMIDVILNEYRHEIAGEFSLWWVLRRTGEHVRYLDEEFGVTVPNGKDLMPIPETQRAANPNLTQNPGY